MKNKYELEVKEMVSDTTVSVEVALPRPVMEYLKVKDGDKIKFVEKKDIVYIMREDNEI